MRLGMIMSCDTADFDNAKGRGLSFIEADKNRPEAIIPFLSETQRIKTDIERTGIDVAAVGRWGADNQNGGRINKEVFSLTEQLLDAAIDIGARNFICGCNYDDSVSAYRNYTAAIEVFGSLLDRAKGKDINIAVYNCEWGNFVNSPEPWKIVHGELPDLKIKYDAAHAIGRDADFMSEINDWAERISYVHLKGILMVKSIGWVDFPPAGMDQIDWKSLISLLYAKGYDGDLALEPHSAVWTKASPLGEAGIDYSIRYFKEMLFDK
jgi:sugar phosphate isomerase/epimerase